MANHQTKSSLKARGVWDETAACAALAKYRGLLRHLAGKYRFAAERCGGLDVEDLLAEGSMAVLEALHDYRNFGLSEKNWVALRIKQRMLDAIRRMDPRARGKKEELRSTETETAQGFRPWQPRIFISLESSSLAESSQFSSWFALREPTADDIVDENSQRQALKNALKQLTDRQRIALELKLKEDLTLSEIATRMGISISRVNQLQLRAIDQLQHMVQLNPEAKAA